MGPSLGSGGRLEADIRTQRARPLRRMGRRRPARLAAPPNARRRGNLRPRHGSPAPPELSNPGQPRPRPPPARSPGASALTPTLATARSQEGGARPPRPGLLRICRLSRVRCSEPAAFPAVRLSAPAYVLGGCSGLTSTPAQLAQVLPLRSLSLLRLGPCACSACSECVATALSPAVRRPVSWARRTPGAPRPPAVAVRRRPSRASSRTPRAPAAPLPDRPPPLPASETEAAAGPRRQGSAGAGRPCQGATKSRGRTFWRGASPRARHRRQLRTLRLSWRSLRDLERVRCTKNARVRVCARMRVELARAALPRGAGWGSRPRCYRIAFPRRAVAVLLFSTLTAEAAAPAGQRPGCRPPGGLGPLFASSLRLQPFALSQASAVCARGPRAPRSPGLPPPRSYVLGRPRCGPSVGGQACRPPHEAQSRF